MDRRKTFPLEEVEIAVPSPDGRGSHVEGGTEIGPQHKTDQAKAAITDFRTGTVKAVGEPYSKMLVVSRTRDEEVDWISENYGGDEYIKFSI